MAQTTGAMSAKSGIVEITTVQTLTDAIVAGAASLIPVDSTTGFLAGDTIEYMLVGGVIEQKVIDSIDPGVSITITATVGAGGIADNEQVNKIVNISGAANSVTVSGGNRMAGDGFTADGDAALITSGKREPVEVTFRGLYTEAAGAPEFFEELAAVYESGAGAGLRWSPSAYDATGKKRFWTTNTLGSYIQIVPITSWNYPSLDFASGDPIMVELTLRSPKIGTTDAT